MRSGFGLRSWFGAGLGLMLMASSCSQKAIDTQRDANVNTQQYKTFRWLSPDDAKYLNLRDPNTNQPVQAWVNVRQQPVTEQRVRDVIEKDLQQYGYTSQNEGLPDFFVTYYSPARDKEWLSSWSGITLAFQGAPLVIYPNFDMHKALEFRPGMAYVVIYDAKTKRPAWTGEVIDAISPQGEVNRPVVTSQVQELIAKFKNSA
ncbi:MAG: DUF4136 domain-containing protein [Bdellovibrionia bacterium]